MVIAALGFFPIMRDLWNWTLGNAAVWVGYELNQTTGKMYTLFNVLALDKKIKLLQTENLKLKAENARYREDLAESQLMQKEKRSAQSEGYGNNAITAKIIGKSPANFLQVYVIDKGQEEGVAVGDAVVSGGFLAGRISQVEDHISRADVISGGQLILPVILQESRSTGMMRGSLEGLVVSEIPQDTAPKKNEIALTQNIENIIVPNVAIGYVRKIINRKGDIFQSVVVESPLDLTQLRIVTIVKAGK